MSAVSTDNLFRHFENRSTVVLDTQDYLESINGPADDPFNSTEWNPTNKYSFEHAYFPMELVRKDPLIEFMFERFGKIQPWILGVNAGVQFDYHMDQSKGAALNFAISPRQEAITLFKHSHYQRRFQTRIGGLRYGDHGRFSLLNNMKDHTVINWGDSPIYTFTIPCRLTQSDFANILDELDDIADVTLDSTYQPGQNLTMPTTELLTPQHLQVIIYNKVLQIMVREGGFDLHR